MRRLTAALLLLAAAPAPAQEVPTPAQEVDVTLATESDGTRTLSHEITIPAPVTEVWQAIATVEGWRTWAVPLVRQVPGSPDRFETGYDPGAAPGAPTTIEQQWVNRECPHRAVFRTTRTPAGFPHADPYRRVTSSFHLEPAGADATRVHLVATGYPAGPEGDALTAFFREGNRISLQQLHRRFATGPMEWPAAPAQPGGE